MNKITQFVVTLTLLTVPSVSFAEVILKDGYSIEGKIFAVKTSKKYASVSGCSKIAMSKKSVKGFTFEEDTNKCFLFKSIRSMKEDSSSVSGTK
jgi:hypothetical protein